MKADWQRVFGLLMRVKRNRNKVFLVYIHSINLVSGKIIFSYFILFSDLS